MQLISWFVFLISDHACIGALFFLPTFKFEYLFISSPYSQDKCTFSKLRFLSNQKAPCLSHAYSMCEVLELLVVMWWRWILIKWYWLLTGAWSFQLHMPNIYLCISQMCTSVICIMMQAEWTTEYGMIASALPAARMFKWLVISNVNAI